MLIKLYCADSTLRIIENVKTPLVHLRKYSFSNLKELEAMDFGPEPYIIPAYVYDLASVVEQPVNCRIIDYADADDVWHRLIVDCWAYICNDQGKTIEKVDAGRL